ncbi:nuclear transport factor 2 family protein [Nonomuraea sp. K274]|uniref:Nuclear transport factor 2 family protein n=1 Tax=Nonomuraea cypriaca TaxID=1187855 RepID=A0A931ACR9_9ACTN|nr:nuclear transport factor 2 family protein [Nonomuraea cypriaca]MBF8189508.1 nuclear transport factor 2 family protein [Nonomuraea cypriaca]
MRTSRSVLDHGRLGVAAVAAVVVLTPGGVPTTPSAAVSPTASVGGDERHYCTEDNLTYVRQGLIAWRRGIWSIHDMFAPDMVWRTEGSSVVAKEYRSKRQFLEEALTPFEARFTESDPFRPTRVRAMYCDNDTVIVVWDGRGTARDGRPYENTHAWFMKMRGGKVVETTSFSDSMAFDDLWKRVRPR